MSASEGAEDNFDMPPHPKTTLRILGRFADNLYLLLGAQDTPCRHFTWPIHWSKVDTYIHPFEEPVVIPFTTPSRGLVNLKTTVYLSVASTDSIKPVNTLLVFGLFINRS